MSYQSQFYIIFFSLSVQVVEKKNSYEKVVPTVKTNTKLL